MHQSVSPLGLQCWTRVRDISLLLSHLLAISPFKLALFLVYIQLHQSTMSSADYPLWQCGIYRNLPNFDPSICNLNAIITGSDGISGFAALRALLDAPKRWSTIHSLSRSGLSSEQLDLIPESLRSHIKEASVGLTRPSQEIANILRKAGFKADYVFFYAYLQPKTRLGHEYEDG